jgi:uncharacterized protein involved in cysteine biosynthesis
MTGSQIRETLFSGGRVYGTLVLSNSPHWPTMVGFGGVAFGACLVPGLNLLILPALVTGGTLLVLRLQPDADAWGRGSAA